MTGKPYSPPQGFTIVELLVTLVIVGILASAILPMAELTVRRTKERELFHALREIRTAIDAYHTAVEDGRIHKKQDDPGYPHRLEDLVNGIPDAKNPKAGKLVFLRRIPRDPFADNALQSDQTWGKRSYASPREERREGENVFDVHSVAAGIGLNGVPYRDW